MGFSLIDFIIGFTLMNAMPHFVLGTTQVRFLSGFGYGDRANIGYGLLNFAVSIILFVYTYSLAGLWSSGIYLGALVVLLIYFGTSKFFYNLFRVGM